jgi:hypothetical protein
MHNVRGWALVAVLGLGIVSSVLRLNRGVPSQRQRVLRQVITILMIAGLVIWFGRHPFR